MSTVTVSVETIVALALPGCRLDPDGGKAVMS
jgi:hypothetical protein